MIRKSEDRPGTTKPQRRCPGGPMTPVWNRKVPGSMLHRTGILHWNLNILGRQAMFSVFSPRSRALLLLALGLVPLLCTDAAARRSVVDQLGREVEVVDDPQRIIALAPSITELVYALGQQDRLRGATRYSDHPPQAASLPKVGSYIRLDLEKIVSLRPDLCIATKDGNPKAVIERLEALGIPVYAVDPRSLESMRRTISALGRLLNCRRRAADIIKAMDRRLEHVRGRTAQRNRRPRVFFQIGIAPIVSVGDNTLIGELIDLAGGQNVAAEGVQAYPRFSREEVLALAPEVIVITSMARGEEFARIKREWNRWPGVPAVRDGRVHVVDSNLFDRPTPRIIDGLEVLAHLIHPETGNPLRP
jgi:iron complex transport system substrate-binding protein